MMCTQQQKQRQQNQSHLHQHQQKQQPLEKKRISVPALLLLRRGGGRGATDFANGDANVQRSQNDFAGDSSTLVSSSTATTAAPAPVPWEDVLLALEPIVCAEGDEECFRLKNLRLEELRQQHQDSQSRLSPNALSAAAVSVSDVAVLGGSVASVALALLYLVSLSGPGAWRYYLSGGICAAASHVIPVPIDTVKTRKQIDPAFARLDFFQAFRTIFQQEGPSGLLAGLGPTFFGYLLEGAIKFGVYEVLKPVVAQTLTNLAGLSIYLAFVDSRVAAFAISAAVSGVAASIMLCPMEALRIRRVADSQSGAGWMFTGYQILRTEGVLALSKGMIPMLYKQVPYTVTKNVSFDFMTRYAYAALLNWRGTAIGPGAKLAVPLAAAAVSSLLSCVTSQPGDMLLSLANANSGDRRRTRDIAYDILQSERGVGGFFVGMKTRFLHVGIIVTLQLFLYDFVKRLCGIASTGMTSLSS